MMSIVAAMRSCCGRIAPALLVFLFFGSSLPAQTEKSTNKQFWPELNVKFELGKLTNVQTSFEKHDGEDASNQQWKLSVVVSHRMRKIVTSRIDPDEENKYNLVVGAGYEFIRTGEGSAAKTENRLLTQATPKYSLGKNVLIQDRNRLEFRWKSGIYDFRYRNKLTIDRPFRINKIRFTPYASGELFWVRNHHSWNENQYAFGVEWPYKKRLRLDTYYLHQNCTTCNPSSLNVFGLTLNLFLNWPKRS